MKKNRSRWEKTSNSATGIPFEDASTCQNKYFWEKEASLEKHGVEQGYAKRRFLWYKIPRYIMYPHDLFSKIACSASGDFL